MGGGEPEYYSGQSIRTSFAVARPFFTILVVHSFHAHNHFAAFLHTLTCGKDSHADCLEYLLSPLSPCSIPPETLLWR